jgi:hypothetical protein
MPWSMISPEPGAAEQVTDRETMYETRRDVDAAGRIVTAERAALIVKIEETAFRVYGAVLEEIEQAVCLIQEPAPMIGKARPAGTLGSAGLIVNAHEDLRIMGTGM